MLLSILWALPAVAVVFLVTTAALRRAPARGFRRLLYLNGLVVLAGFLLGALLLLGVVDPAQAATPTAAASAEPRLIVGAIHVGSIKDAG